MVQRQWKPRLGGHPNVSIADSLWDLFRQLWEPGLQEPQAGLRPPNAWPQVSHRSPSTCTFPPTSWDGGAAALQGPKVAREGGELPWELGLMPRPHFSLNKAFPRTDLVTSSVTRFPIVLQLCVPHWPLGESLTAWSW